jgi:hypothetical protein
MIEQTQFSYQDLRALKPNSIQEIEGKLRRGFISRLSLRVKKLRKLIVERNWENLRDECIGLSTSSYSFGFAELAYLADQVQSSIPLGKIPRAATPTKAKEFAESLVNAIDSLLVESASNQLLGLQ